jgi:hypothetical protein
MAFDAMSGPYSLILIQRITIKKGRNLINSPAFKS